MLTGLIIVVALLALGAGLATVLRVITSARSLTKSLDAARAQLEPLVMQVVSETKELAARATSLRPR